MFLLCQHENRKHQFGRQDCFNKHSLRQTCPRTQRRPDIKRRREQYTHEITRENAARNLRSNQQASTRPRHGATKQHSKRNRGIKQATADPKEDPDVNHETEAEHECDVEQDVGREPRRFTSRGVFFRRRSPNIRNLRPGKGED
jgi:hypothetical protein